MHDVVYYVFLTLTAFQFPPWQAAFPLGRHLQEQVCRGAAFFLAADSFHMQHLDSPCGLLDVGHKKGAQLANQGDGSPCSRSELGCRDMKIGMTFYKIEFAGFQSNLFGENEALH